MHTGYILHVTRCKPAVALAKDTVLLSNQAAALPFCAVIQFTNKKHWRRLQESLKVPRIIPVYVSASSEHTEEGISGDTACLSIPGFICLFSDSQENKRYLNKRKGALNSLVAKASQLNLFSFNEDLSWNLSPEGIKQLLWCFNFIILP